MEELQIQPSLTEGVTQPVPAEPGATRLQSPLLEPREAKSTSKRIHLEPGRGTSSPPVSRKRPELWRLRESRDLGCGCRAWSPLTHLSFREAEAMRQLLPLGAHHVVVLLEGVFQPQKLGRGKGGSDPLRLSGQRVVQKEALWACVIPCGEHGRSPIREGRALLLSRADPAPRSWPPGSGYVWAYGGPGASRGTKRTLFQLPGLDRWDRTCAAPTQQSPRRGESPGSRPRRASQPPWRHGPRYLRAAPGAGARGGGSKAGLGDGAQDPKKWLSLPSNLWKNFALGIRGGEAKGSYLEFSPRPIFFFKC